MFPYVEPCGSRASQYDYAPTTIFEGATWQYKYARVVLPQLYSTTRPNETFIKTSSKKIIIILIVNEFVILKVKFYYDF